VSGLYAELLDSTPCPVGDKATIEHRSRKLPERARLTALTSRLALVRMRILRLKNARPLACGSTQPMKRGGEDSFTPDREPI